jgi:hypothetical protein
MGYYDALGTWREGDPMEYSAAQQSQPYTGGHIGDSRYSLGQLATGYDIIAQQYNNSGMNPIHGAGIAGSAYKESDGFTTGVQYNNGPGRGYFQWELPQNGGSGRGLQFENYLRATEQPNGPLNYMSTTGNIGFLNQEMGQPGFAGMASPTWFTETPGAASRAFTGSAQAGSGYLRPRESAADYPQRAGAANASYNYWASQQDPGYFSGNYYGDYGVSGDIQRVMTPQYASEVSQNPNFDAGGYYTGGVGNVQYQKGGSTGPQYVTDSSGITRAVQGQQSYGNNEYGYGGGYDPQAYGYQQDYSGGLMGGQNTTGYMNYSGQPDFTVGGSSGSSGGYDWSSPGGYGAGASYSPGYSIQPGTAAASYGGGMTLGDTQMAGQVYDASQAYAQQYADQYQNQMNNQMQTQQMQGQNQFNQNMMNTGTSTYAGGGNLFTQYQPY